MNNETTTIDLAAHHPGHFSQKSSAPASALDAELRRIALTLLALLDQRPPSAGTRSPRQIILYLANRYEGSEPVKFDHLCRGLYLMAEGHFREALNEFDQVLEGQVDPDFEIVREVTLETHAYCLQQLDYDDAALEQFARLMCQKFEETRASGNVDHVARLLGLG